VFNSHLKCSWHESWSQLSWLWFFCSFPQLSWICVSDFMDVQTTPNGFISFQTSCPAHSFIHSFMLFLLLSAKIRNRIKEIMSFLINDISNKTWDAISDSVRYILRCSLWSSQLVSIAGHLANTAVITIGIILLLTGPCKAGSVTKGGSCAATWGRGSQESVRSTSEPT